jgi:imidazolonepropionase-like amidohydrolase
VTLAWLAAGPASVVGARGALVQPTASGPARLVSTSHGASASLTAAASRPDRAPSSIPEQAALIERTLARAPWAAAAPARIRVDSATSLRLAARLLQSLRAGADPLDAGLVVGLPSSPEMLTELDAAARRPVPCLSRLTPEASLEALRLAARAAASGPFVLGSGASPAGPRALRPAAHALVAEGVPPESVLQALTSTAARAASAGDRGRIAPGAIADLVLWDGDPLHGASRPLRAWVAGEEVHAAHP